MDRQDVRESSTRQRLITAFERLSRDLGREAARQGLTEEELFAELKRVKQEVYQDWYVKRS